MSDRPFYPDQAPAEETADAVLEQISGDADAAEAGDVEAAEEGKAEETQTASFSGFLHYKQTVTNLITDLKKLREFSES